MAAPALKTTPLTLRQYAVLALLLALPLIAVATQMPRFWVALAYVLVMSVATYGLYGFDKVRAQAGKWRIPESRLHLFALFGGWPGAYLAQRRFRHKTAKGFFQGVFWVIVLLYQAASIDALLGMSILRRLMGT